MVTSEMIAKIRSRFNLEDGVPSSISRKDMIAFCSENKIPWPKGFIDANVDTNSPDVINIPAGSMNKEIVPSMNTKNSQDVDRNEALVSDFSYLGGESLIPDKSSSYVPFGNYRAIEKIIKSRKFFPIFTTGPSGNGKTMTYDQVCASLGREMFRVNITEETDEDDLLGGFRMIDGTMTFRAGPVVSAMVRGAVLLLDELDYASYKIACLQPVLEGKAVFLKKINRRITPAPGFTVVATANTKGRGSDDGKYAGARVMNEAFLERFRLMFNQEWPPVAAETKILNKYFNHMNSQDPANAVPNQEFGTFVKNLVTWANKTREFEKTGICNDCISTRRLVGICETYHIFRDRLKSVRLGVNRFPAETASQFADAYTAIDADAAKQAVEGTVTPEDIDLGDSPENVVF